MSTHIPLLYNSHFSTHSLQKVSWSDSVSDLTTVISIYNMSGCGIETVGIANSDPFLLRKETGFISCYLGNSHPTTSNNTWTGKEKAEYRPVCLFVSWPRTTCPPSSIIDASRCRSSHSFCFSGYPITAVVSASQLFCKTIQMHSLPQTRKASFITQPLPAALQLQELSSSLPSSFPQAHHLGHTHTISSKEIVTVLFFTTFRNTKNIPMHVRGMCFQGS